MAEPFDLRKLFADPGKFSSTDKGSLIGHEMATELYVTRLPQDFDVERFLNGFASIALLENPDTPECAWGDGSNGLGRHLIFAFKAPVVTEDVRQILAETVDAQLKSQGYNNQNCAYEIISGNENKFPEISRIADQWKPDAP